MGDLRSGFLRANAHTVADSVLDAYSVGDSLARSVPIRVREAAHSHTQTMPDHRLFNSYKIMQHGGRTRELAKPLLLIARVYNLDIPIEA